MRRVVHFGRERIEFEVADLVGRPRDESPTLDPALAIRAALEKPHAFPPLRRALTPGDNITVVLDEGLQQLVPLLVPLLENITGAGVEAANVTLLCPTTSRQEWVNDLPEALEDVKVEVHDPVDRKRLSYLATMRGGHRLYLNRTLVDADQAVVLSRRLYDPLLGYGGAEGLLYPALSDDETLMAMEARLRIDAPGEEPWSTRREAIEAAWLLGLPFFVQVIEGADGGVAHVVAGTAEASVEGQRLLDQRWKQTLARPAEIVVASLSGDPARRTFADFAAAATSAARAVERGGRIILLTGSAPELGPSGPVLLGADGMEQVAAALREKPTRERLPALQWASAASHARLYLLSGWDDELVEDLGATALQNAGQAQRLLDAGGACLFLDDADKALVVVESEDSSEPRTK